jgi:hypothetical protein
MQPIKTTNAMNPAPAKGIESFPTPVIDDVVIAEVVNAWKGDYQKLEYGTLWKDVSHAPNQGSFPEHKLVFQQPTSEDGQWIKRIWVNDRVNQDSYNYAIKYSAGSQDHPIYVRNYVVPRETYTPLPDGTPDPLFPIALLVDEEANRIEGELDSKYVSVTRVYETLPGPEVPTKRYNERGDLETVLVQTVPPFTPPDPDGLLVTGSQVVQEELGKGVKTTSTVQDHSLLQIKEKKEGLLGETITTDDIVEPSTDPDALSQTVVSSVVEQFSATKARKRTTTASGPTLLPSDSLVDSPLGLVLAHIEKQIVPATETASNDSLTNFKRVKDSISPIDSAKSERETVDVSEWPENVSVVGDEVIDIPVFYKETIRSPTTYAVGGGSGSYDIKAIDQWKGLLRRVDIDKFDESIEDKWYKLPSQIDITLPDILKSVKVYWGGSLGQGGDYDFGGGAFTGSYNRNQSGSSKSSYSINGDIYFDVQKGFSGSVPGFTHVFFLKARRLNFGDILTRLNQLESTTTGSPVVYSNWPYLQISRENLILIGGSKSQTNSKSLSESVSINGFSKSTGAGKSFDVNVNVNSVIIPEALHDLIDISEEFIGISPAGNAGLDLTYGVRPISLQQSRALINGTQIACPRFPTGNYLVSATSELYKYGWAKITAKTADITANYTSA